MRFDKIVAGGNVVTPLGASIADIGIVGEKIAAIDPALERDGAKVIDARGYHVIPGVLDVHVHLELPFCGTVSADDYRTGTRAGARGGVTTLIDVSDVRGMGLMLGMELVRDRATKAPAKAETLDLLELTREMGLLIGKGGLDGNVIRIKPPMCITADDADFALEVIHRALESIETRNT